MTFVELIDILHTITKTVCLVITTTKQVMKFTKERHEK